MGVFQGSRAPGLWKYHTIIPQRCRYWRFSLSRLESDIKCLDMLQADLKDSLKPLQQFHVAMDAKLVIIPVIWYVYSTHIYWAHYKEV